MNDAMGKEPAWIGDVLRFWFEELSERDWFAKSEALDARIATRFLAVRGQLVDADAAGVESPRELLAAVIVLDQFSRNIFRDDPRAFSADPLARRLATRAIERGLDAELPRERRMFLYLPFEHSEDRADQARSVALMQGLGDENLIRYAQQHKDLIDRFGRFPHRNAVLGRETTDEEFQALKGPFGSF